MTEPTSSPPLSVLVFGASLRTESLNQKLAALAARVARDFGATVDLAMMRDFDVPLYNGDVEAAAGNTHGSENVSRPTPRQRRLHRLLA